MYETTTATLKILALKKRIRAIQGGTSAGKTVAIMQVLIDYCQQEHETEQLVSVVAESFPHLRRGAMRDFLLIMKTQGYFKDAKWNKSESTYTFERGHKIEFFSVDQGDKVRGARRDVLFINEANNISFEAFEQLEVRTKEFIFLDWNPSNEFWFYTEIVDKRTDYEVIILTYLDNEALSVEIINSIEQRKNRRGWWQVYGMGLPGEVEGKIYKDWKIIDELPHEAKLVGYGLDFGYTNDPTAIVALYKWNSAYIIDQITFQRGLSNSQIAAIFNNIDEALVIADSSEPKSIEEIAEHGINILPAVKGRGSVNQGIQFVQDQRIFVTRRSFNVIKEYRNYLWQTDPNGKIINVPEGGFDHSMDAIRYILNSIKPTKSAEEIMRALPKENMVSKNGFY